ncbi:conserved hypothetical protein [Ralstonia solanacearum Po82]|uniref:Uncharacterized protein n=1 Tax=Ralstonia solanacearum (strain Po82) TaxID=1031711 RepID=F6G6T4_RALS8|nr:conserved hypothetical protein [Ralstonia solanacearum Po82]AMP74091.1 hypothetical protein RALBFv3_07940 [Ralstonia solanacearum]
MPFAMVRVVAMQGASPAVPRAHALGRHGRGSAANVPASDAAERVDGPRGSSTVCLGLRGLDGAITELSAGALTRTAQSTPCDNAGRSIVI